MLRPFQVYVHQLHTDAESLARHFKVRASLGVFLGVIDPYLQVFKGRILIHPVSLTEASRHLVQLDAAGDPVVISAVFLHVGHGHFKAVQRADIGFVEDVEVEVDSCLAVDVSKGGLRVFT